MIPESSDIALRLAVAALGGLAVGVASNTLFKLALAMAIGWGLFPVPWPA
jgi:hypothetical protein